MTSVRNEYGNFERGDLVRVHVSLRNGRRATVAGEVREVEPDRVVVATTAGLRICHPCYLSAWPKPEENKETSIRRIAIPDLDPEYEEKTLPSA